MLGSHAAYSNHFGVFIIASGKMTKRGSESDAARAPSRQRGGSGGVGVNRGPQLISAPGPQVGKYSHDHLLCYSEDENNEYI